MALVPTSGPAVEPVSLSEVKAHLRVTVAAEDILILSLITAARVQIELSLDSALITQSWSLFLDRWPDSPMLPLPLSPVRSIAAIRVLSVGGSIAVLPATDYVLAGQGAPPRLVRRDSASWRAAAPAPAYPANGIEVDFIAGYGPVGGDVPAPVRQALLLLVAHWYRRREPVDVGRTGQPLPSLLDGLLAPYRQVRL